MDIHENILTAIGNTPLVKLNKLVGPNDATVLDLGPVAETDVPAVQPCTYLRELVQHSPALLVDRVIRMAIARGETQLSERA